MSMTTGDELSKSDMLLKLAVMLFPLAKEAVRQGMTMKDFERLLDRRCVVSLTVRLRPELGNIDHRSIGNK